MAFTALPMLFYNLGGEMLYVLDQRLIAQNIPIEKAKRVLIDIMSTMYNFESFQSIIKPQPIFSFGAMKGIFTKIVHSSIMKVNTDSMDKLYDLMVMSVKYQVLQCSSAMELMHSTLNHFDITFTYAGSDVALTDNIKVIYSKMVSMYGSIEVGEFLLLKQALLYFLQDSHSKVSVYLSLNKQNEYGRFVVAKKGKIPTGYDVPGKITTYTHDESGKEIAVETDFESGCKFEIPTKIDDLSRFSNEIGGMRCTDLGGNIYKKVASSDCAVENDVPVSDPEPVSSGSTRDSTRYAQAELGILARMIGAADKDSSSESMYEFKLSMLSSDISQFHSDDGRPATSSLDPDLQNQHVVKIVPEKRGKQELNQIIADLTVSSSAKKSTKGEDLLSLMDS